MKPQPTATAAPAAVQTLRSKATASVPRPRQGKNGAWRRFVSYGIGGALLFLLIAGLRSRPVEVETATVAKGSLTVSVLEEGKTRIRHRYVISPPVSGFLNRVPLRAGARIEAGKTVLATLQPQPASFLDPRARAEAEARVKGAEAAKMQRETQIARARDALDLAEKERTRAQTLRKSGAIAIREWDTADMQVSMFSRELRTAEFALQVAEFERAQAEAALVQAKHPEAGMGAAPLEIISPVSGFVLNVVEESARILPAGAPIMEVGDPSDLEAEIELLSSDAVGVQPGAEVSIEQWGGDQSLRGRVLVVEPGGYTKISALGVEEQRVKVRVEFFGGLPPGAVLGDRYRVEARIVTWRGENVLQVPTGALFRRGGDWMAFVLDGTKARATKIEIAHNNGAAAEVRAGLKEGQRVVLHPPDSIADGAAVKPR